MTQFLRHHFSSAGVFPQTASVPFRGCKEKAESLLLVLSGYKNGHIRESGTIEEQRADKGTKEDVKLEIF